MVTLISTIISTIGQRPAPLALTQELKLELPFLCQIDEQTHSALESSYWCDQCAMHICGSCYLALATVVDLTTCHHCYGSLNMVLEIDKI